ncbi:MAG: hypothetical protein ABI662_07100 [Dermatophilaceae bacterium]
MPPWAGTPDVVAEGVQPFARSSSLNRAGALLAYVWFVLGAPRVFGEGRLRRRPDPVLRAPIHNRQTARLYGHQTRPAWN